MRVVVKENAVRGIVLSSNSRWRSWRFRVNVDHEDRERSPQAHNVKTVIDTSQSFMHNHGPDFRSPDLQVSSVTFKEYFSGLSLLWESDTVKNVQGKRNQLLSTTSW